MQELEKILEEIEQAKRESWYRLNNYDVKNKLDGAINRIVDIIRKHMNDEWIPVEERLPTMKEYQKNDGRFILYDGNRRCVGYFDVYTGRFYSYRHITLYRAELYRDDKIIAWRPLPEPYRPERSDAE